MPATMKSRELDTEELVEQARAGDAAARQHLLTRHRQRLCAMVAVRLDRRLAARLDPSDIVQEALAEADRKLDEYLRHPPLPYYPWLRQIAWERLVKVHRHHLRARKRSVRREEPQPLALPNSSGMKLAERLMNSATSPSRRLVRDELRGRVQAALARLDDSDREVLVLRYLEQLSNPETAAVLAIGESAAKMRHMRALERLRALLLDGNVNEDEA
jgi:RNA polymerase sigma-70 factor (ECF subfamily)